jgi:hypothetical protein
MIPVDDNADFLAVRCIGGLVALSPAETLAVARRLDVEASSVCVAPRTDARDAAARAVELRSTESSIFVTSAKLGPPSESLTLLARGATACVVADWPRSEAAVVRRNVAVADALRRVVARWGCTNENATRQMEQSLSFATYFRDCKFKQFCSIPEQLGCHPEVYKVVCQTMYTCLCRRLCAIPTILFELSRDMSTDMPGLIPDCT